MPREENQNIVQNVTISDKTIGVPQLLGAPALVLPQAYAYANRNSTFT